DEALHLLPALPDTWHEGSVKGLKARGGFEVDLNWQNNQVHSVKITSNLGGNLRLRSTEVLVDKNGNELTKASGENKNIFYQTPDIKTPLVSAQAEITPLELPQ